MHLGGPVSGSEECYRDFERKSRRQYYLSILAERLTGKDPKAIAESLHLTETSVLRALDYVRENWSLIFSPDGPGNGATRKAKRPCSTSRIRMLEAKCEGCGALIPKGEERMVLVGFALGYIQLDEEEELDNLCLDAYADESGHVSNADLRNVFHYCNSCGTTEELRVRNPWRVRATAEQIEWMKKREAEGLAESAAESERLSKAVAVGDMHTFNKAMPTTPKWTDAMARAFSGQATHGESEKGTALMAALGEGDDETVSPSEAFDNLASTKSPDRPSGYLRGPEACAAGEAAQRAKLSDFLNSPASRGKFMPNKRKALKMWADGVSQPEVARECGIDQGNFSRMKNAALAEAYKAC